MLMMKMLMMKILMMTMMMFDNADGAGDSEAHSQEALERFSLQIQNPNSATRLSEHADLFILNK